MSNLMSNLEEFFEEAWEKDRQALLQIIATVVMLVVIFALAINHALSSQTPQLLVHQTPIYDAVRGQEVVFEHSNHEDETGNTVYVYCDLPSFDRIYIVNHDHVTVEPGGCKGLP